MSEIKLPSEVASPHSDMFDNITEYLKSEGYINANELLEKAELDFASGERVVLKNYETIPI